MFYYYCCVITLMFVWRFLSFSVTPSEMNNVRCFRGHYLRRAASRFQWRQLPSVEWIEYGQECDPRRRHFLIIFKTASLIFIVMTFLTKKNIFSSSASNEISAASFFHKVAAWFLVVFCNFYLVKNHKIAKKNSPTAKAREKDTHRFGILRILEKFWFMFD